VHPNPLLLIEGAEVRIGGRTLRIVRRAGTDQRPIVRLEGSSSRSDAEAIRGQEMFVERSDAPDLEADEWWAEDLEGCTVHDAGRELGTVRRLLALPSCEVLEVERSGGRSDVLVPLVSDAVREVDIERRRIEVDLGFLGEG
jgi:16S rRNA processing protein RimM